MRSDTRAKSYRRNPALEELMGELQKLLKPAEALALEGAAAAPRPLIFVVGAPRSGTTLMVQWLASSGAVAYPSNLLARFWHAPAIGARIQQLLIDERFRFRDELDDLAPKALGFVSDLGKTSGALAPSEFWYFWRRFLPTSELEPLGARTKDVDVEGLRSSLAALTDVLGRPFAAKGMMLQYDLEFFAKALPEALFLHVEREGVANTTSLLAARSRFFGSFERWYSAKPPEYQQLLALPPEDQVAGQVFHTNRRIREDLSRLPEERSLHVPYEAFCDSPATYFKQLAARLEPLSNTLGQKFDASAFTDYSGPTSFSRPKTAPSSAGPSPASGSKPGSSVSPDLAAVRAAWNRLS